MIILSLDTTTRVGSCALMRDGVVLQEEAGDASREQASRLPGGLATMLAREGIAIADVDLFVATTGPGSFTGLRVGIATMQGLAMAVGRPLIGVSALDALAHIVWVRRPVHGMRIVTWMEAWRQEVFAAVYAEGRAVAPPTVNTPEALLRGLAGQTVCFVGDGALRYREPIRMALGDRAQFLEPVSPAVAGAVAELAGRAYLAGERPSPHAIVPIYVQRSDAELTGSPGPV